METLLKELRERLRFLESEPQTEENRIRKNELSLVIMRVQQKALDELTDMFCRCACPQDTFDGTRRCVYCSKKIPIIPFQKKI